MKPARAVGMAIFVLMGCFGAFQVSAQTPGPQANANMQPKVTRIEGNLEADDLILVDIDNLAEWVKTNDPKKLVPYLNGLALRGNYPNEIHASKNHVRFHLQILPENKHAWVDLLGAPEGIRKPVLFSVGPEDQSAFDTVYDQSNPAQLTVISKWYGIIALAVVLVTLALLPEVAPFPASQVR